MTADITQKNHTVANADVGLQSHQCLSGLNSSIIHMIDIDTN